MVVRGRPSHCPVLKEAHPCLCFMKYAFRNGMSFRFALSPKLCSFQNPMAQQIKAGPAAHAALDRLEPADLAFHRAGAPRQGTVKTLGVRQPWPRWRRDRLRSRTAVRPGAELAVDDGAADLEQAIGAAAPPVHLLLFVHAPVDQEVGGAFGDRGADPLTGAMTLGIVDQPGALAGEIAVDLAQRRPQPARRGAL